MISTTWHFLVVTQDALNKETEVGRFLYHNEAFNECLRLGKLYAAANHSKIFTIKRVYAGQREKMSFSKRFV